MGMCSVRAPAAPSNTRAAGEKGFSLLELLTVLAIIGIISAVSYVFFFNALPNIKADSAMQLLEVQLRQAREYSVDQRSNITVTFQGTRELVTACVANCKGGQTTLSDYFLPYGMVYTLFAGVPDTPDLYGNGSAVTFGCTALPCQIMFQSDGSVVNFTTGAYQNGTVFMGMTNQSLTARAVTTLATTGKTKGYRWNGSVWH
ncbi:MAG: type II secretion system protein [Terriglobia bacterium]|jgi:prepilin-type N-terminal cleavage/methylation domain-containing protein